MTHARLSEYHCSPRSLGAPMARPGAVLGGPKGLEPPHAYRRTACRRLASRADSLHSPAHAGLCDITVLVCVVALSSATYALSRQATPREALGLNALNRQTTDTWRHDVNEDTALDLEFAITELETRQ